MQKLRDIGLFVAIIISIAALSVAIETRARLEIETCMDHGYQDQTISAMNRKNHTLLFKCEGKR